MARSGGGGPYVPLRPKLDAASVDTWPRRVAIGAHHPLASQALDGKIHLRDIDLPTLMRRQGADLYACCHGAFRQRHRTPRLIEPPLIPDGEFDKDEFVQLPRRGLTVAKTGALYHTSPLPVWVSLRRPQNRQEQAGERLGAAARQGW